MTADLSSLLHVSEVAQSELEAVLLSHFGGARGGDHFKELLYARGSSDLIALKTRYNKKGRLTQILRGEAAADADIEELRDKVERGLLAAGEPAVARAVFFSPVPVEGSWRRENCVQILPPPPSAPRPPHLVGDYPCIIEFAYRRSSLFEVTSDRRAAAESDLGLLLGLFTRGYLRAQSRVSQKHWVICPSSGDGRVEWAQEGYGCDGGGGEGVTFSSAEGVGPMRLVPWRDYYSRPLGISFDSRLELPDCMALLFEKFWALDSNSRTDFLRASFWMQHSRAVWKLSHTASYMAVITAIEAMLSSSVTSLCKTCHRPLDDGPTSAFAAFLNAHGQQMQGGFSAKQLYSLRSRLAHGDRLFQVDGALMPANPSAHEESSKHDEAMQLATGALVDWLLSQ